MDFERVDMREMTPEELIEANEMAQIVFKINHTMPNTDEYNNLLKELLGANLGENSMVMAPIAGAAFDHIKIGNNVLMNMTDRFCFASRYISKKEHGLVPVQVFFLV